MSNSDSSSLSYRQKQVDNTLNDHDDRITRNEKFRYLMTGAVAVLSMNEGGNALLQTLTALI